MKTRHPSGVFLLLAATVALVLAIAGCGGGSSKTSTPTAGARGTPTRSTTAGKTPTTSPGATARLGTGAATASAGTASGSPVGSGTETAANSDAQPDVTFAGDTVTPGTAAQGTPPPTVAGDAATIAAGASTAVAAGATATDTASPAGDATATIVTAPPVGAPPSISLDAPATASGDFTVTVRLDGVAQPYTGFNVYLTFDPSVVTSTGGTAGAALASSPDQYFCTGAADKVPGAESLGCTLLGTTSTNNGVLATFAFQRIGPGTTQLHMRTATDGGAIQGTYIIVNVGDSPTPLDIVVNDASVVVS